MTPGVWYCQKCGFKNAGSSFCGQCSGPKLLWENVRGLLYYLFLIFTFLLLVFELSFLVEATGTFRDVFKSFNANLPGPVLMVISLGDHLRPVKGLLLLILLVITVVCAVNPTLKRKTKITYLILAFVVFCLACALSMGIMFMPMFTINVQ